ncbi:acyltransferase domain-containing protein [Streptomyces massasporeus]|uniref:acyltransferase domain-containing protein n=1 Tax=Streptomyces massasporeus TaxID=67324 RepID=UPI00379D749C
MLPDADALPEILPDLAVPHEDINDLVALRRTLTADVRAIGLLEECVEDLVRDIDEVGVEVPLAERVAEAPAALGRYFAVFVFVAALPHTRAYHRERGVTADVSRRTLADLGRNMAFHRRRRGSGGWRSRSGSRTTSAVSCTNWDGSSSSGPASGSGRGGRWRRPGWTRHRGRPCLSVHIPDFHGALSPAACDRSLELAREFFARHFPRERHRVAVCHSWPLDPLLKRHLDPDSNIVRFQGRFDEALAEAGLRVRTAI